jgi:hypothetical protein
MSLRIELNLERLKELARPHWKKYLPDFSESVF